MVSIIMPVYNVEKYIAKSIQSVLNQTYKNFELLVIIDGSLDASKQIAETFIDTRISIYEKINGGLSDARNFGLNNANGEYVYFLDSDDWIEPNLLEICLQKIEHNESDFIVFGYFLDNEDDKCNLISTKEIFYKETVFNKEKNNLDIDEVMLNLLGYAWNKLYKTSFLKKNEILFDKNISLVEDILFNSKVYKESDKLVFIENRLYHYINRQSTSLIKTFHGNSFELYLKKCSAIISFLDSWNIDMRKQNKIISNVVVSAIRYSVNNLFEFKSNLTESEKIASIRVILNNVATQKYISHYIPLSFIDKIYKIIIINKAVFMLYLLCKIRK